MIDWDEEWRAAQRTCARPPRAAEWDQRATSFSRRAPDSSYEDRVLQLLAPPRSWSVLDVGSGAGTLAVPLASRVTSVTALDFSPAMLDQLRRRCAEDGIVNVSAVLGRWEDDWERLGIGMHDLALASRSMVVEDLHAAVTKLDRAALRMVCISAPAGGGSQDRRVFDAVGRPFQPGPDYIYVYNLLHQMGIFANVSFISQDQWRVYESREAGLEAMRWMLRDVTPAELERLRAYVEAELVRHEHGWRLRAPSTVRWAVIWWTKDPSWRGTPEPACACERTVEGPRDLEPQPKPHTQDKETYRERSDR